MSKLSRLFQRPTEERVSWNDYVQLVIANTWNAYIGDTRDDYTGFFERNPIIFAAVRQRWQMFSQAVFKFQRLRNGRPGDLVGMPELAVLERPKPGMTTADLLTLWEMDVSLHGIAFAWRRDGVIEVPRPDWVTQIREQTRTFDGRVISEEIVAYEYRHEGVNDPVLIDPAREPVARFVETPDPRDRFRGMSWITAAASEARADNSLTDYKNKFFEHAATPNLAIMSEAPLTDEQYKRLQEQMARRHEGVENAHRTLILEGAGAKIEKVGAALGELSFTNVQDAGENRIALASGVPAPLIGIQLGTNPTYNNFNTARRHFADAWARPMWRKAAGALEAIVPPPVGMRLWYDDRDIEALQQDADDEAAIRQKDAATLRQLVDGGFTPESAVAFVASSDPAVLKHTGNLSVQLLPNGTAPDAT